MSLLCQTGLFGRAQWSTLATVLHETSTIFPVMRWRLFRTRDRIWTNYNGSDLHQKTSFLAFNLTLHDNGILDGITRLLPDWLSSILQAVPKKKTSHSRKRMRSAHKQLHDRQDLVQCEGCGRAKTARHLCIHCYGDLLRQWKREIPRHPEMGEGLRARQRLGQE